MRVTDEINSLFLFLVILAVFFFFLTQGLLIYFALKYRRKRGEEPTETPYITGNNILETIWIVIPTIVVIIVFIYSFRVYKHIIDPIPGAQEINVTAMKWLWKFDYGDEGNGKKTTNDLRVAVDQPIKLIMTSDDVIHSLYIPDFKIKQDVVPGMYTALYFTPNKLGTYNIVCAEFCGAGHSKMYARLTIMKRDEYDKWIKGDGGEKPGKVPSAKGRELVEEAGCTACHTDDGTADVAPSFKGIFGRTTKLDDGTTLTVDENYIMESIIDPEAKLVEGFDPVMPSFKEELSREDITAIINYLKTLK